MRLKSIEIQGFKSFPDKTKLTFDKDITAVIGPNGSGKSNISDSVRWVLGEQSSKSLRGQKMEDVIFGGTALRKALGFAEVSLALDNTDRKLKYDNDEVIVTRRYFRSGDSEYKINGATVRLKDIHELFMDTGLGRDGYSMIGQGRIDEIVGSKSDERRDIFEEAAGISRFRYRKIEAERKLNHAEENLIRLRDIMAELQSRVGPLAEQSKKAQEFLSYSGEKRELEIGLWLNTLNNSKELLREQDYKITLAKSQYEKIERELVAIEQEFEIGSQDSQKIIVQIDAIRRAAAQAEEQAAEIRGEIAVLENTIFHNNETIARLNRDIETANSDDESVDREIALKQKNIEEIELTAGKKADELNAALEKLNSLADDSGDFSQKIEDKNNQLNLLTAQISEKRVKLVTAQTSQSEIESGFSLLDANMLQLESQIAAATEEIGAINKDLENCENQIQECANIVKGHEFKVQSRRNKAEEKKAELDKLQLDIGEKLRRAQILEDLEKNLEGFSYAVKAVSKQAAHGMLKGIHGPVSRLISVPSEYATAIEIALGAAMQNIVTQTEEDAKRAINFLKTSNGGRTTFLPLTNIKSNPLKESGLDGCVGFVGIAAELIKYDAKYKDVVGSLLARTVVAEDMDSAVAMARKFGYRFKVVTLDGQVVNAGGSLTGGSHAKNAGLLNRAGQIEDIRKQAQKMQEEYDSKAQQFKQITEELSKMNAELIAAQSELTTANEDKIRLNGELKRLTEQNLTSTAQLDAIKKQKSESVGRVDTYLEEAKVVSGEILLAEAKKAEIEAEISLLTGGRDKLSEVRNNLSEQVSALRLELIGYTKDTEAIKPAIAQLESAKTDRESRVAQLNSEIAELNLKNEENTVKIGELNQLTTGFSQQSTSSEQEIAQLNQKRTELEQRNYKLRNDEREKTSDREKISGELARLTERKDVMEKELDDIIGKLYDEYELTRNEAEQMGIVIDDIPKATKRLNELKQSIRKLGSVNVSAIEEYKEVAERYEFMKAQIDDVEKSRSELYKLISELTSTMKEMFITQFDLINKNFTEVFKELFGGGTAELRLTDPKEVLETGIEIIAQPPGKNISIIEQLSGGEKALIAVAIYFAIMKVNPPPFCLLDEVEAALDEVNVDRFAAYLRRMSGATQFIIITHRRGTMEEADVLYGVTMQEKGVSKLLSIDVSQIEKTLGNK